MTKLSNIPVKETAAKAARTRKAKTAPTAPPWDPPRPLQFTQEEIWEHIHEIEKGPFLTLDEGFKRFEAWKQDLLKSRL